MISTTINEKDTIQSFVNQEKENKISLQNETEGDIFYKNDKEFSDKMRDILANKKDDDRAKIIYNDFYLSKHIRDIFPYYSDDEIIVFINQDEKLTSFIRYFFKSGDDSWIKKKITDNQNLISKFISETNNLQLNQIIYQNSQIINNASKLPKINSNHQIEHENQIMGNHNMHDHSQKDEPECDINTNHDNAFSDKICEIIANKNDDELIKIVYNDFYLGKRIRNIFPYYSDDEIIVFIKQDEKLTSFIRNFFKSGDDSWIKKQITENQNQTLNF